jgi:hypothetical protein
MPPVAIGASMMVGDPPAPPADPPVALVDPPVGPPVDPPVEIGASTTVGNPPLPVRASGEVLPPTPPDPGGDPSLRGAVPESMAEVPPNWEVSLERASGFWLGLAKHPARRKATKGIARLGLSERMVLLDSLSSARRC